MCSCPPRPPSCTLTSTRSTHRSSSATIRRCAAGPVIVGGGVVLAASYEAKAYGVRTAMGGGQARALCPHAVVVPPRMSAYSEASAAVFEVFHDTSPLVEPLVGRRGLPRCGRARSGVGHPRADRRTAARAGARPGRPADHRRDRADEVPGQGRQPGSQTRRSAAGSPRSGTGLSASSAGTTTLGRRREDRRQAARARHRDRRRRRRTERDHPGIVASAAAMGQAVVRAVAQHRPPPGGHRATPSLGRRPTCARAGRQHACRRPRSTPWW